MLGRILNLEKTNVLKFRKRKGKVFVSSKNRRIEEEVSEFCYFMIWFESNERHDLKRKIIENALKAVEPGEVYVRGSFRKKTGRGILSLNIEVKEETMFEIIQYRF